MAANDIVSPLQSPSSIRLQEAIQRPELAHLHTSPQNRRRCSVASCTAPSIDSCCAARVVPKKPKGLRNIKFSKTTRIALLLGIDTAFFLLELIAGEYYEGFMILKPSRISNPSRTKRSQDMPSTRSLSSLTRSTCSTMFFHYV
jgi:hypothetical protein